MQLTNIRQGLKPLTLAVGLVAGSPFSLYADVDQFSNIDSVITNHITANYINEVNSLDELYLNDKRRFNTLFNSWREQTMFMSSVQGIIEQKDFQAIISMGVKAVPFIIDEIEAKPSNLVWALNLIFNRKITNNPKATITDACKLWVKALKS